jgi:serine/threonine-protein kinase
VTDDPRIKALLEKLQESGGTPEEVCRSCPELLPQVRKRWLQMLVLEAQLGQLFPPSDPELDPITSGVTANPLPTGAGSDGKGEKVNSRRPVRTELPTIRGYEIQGVLGQGGVGVVYKTWHLRLNRPVALKMLLAGSYARLGEVERFLREAEAVASLRHPNIVQVYDVGDADGCPYFTMELIEGGSLAQKLEGTPYRAHQAAVLVATLAEAIQAAHQCGFIHRDLKPSNVLLTADGTPKVTDFGLARRLEGSVGLTLSGAPMGTPSYMAPEQARGDKGAIGPATDVYALGAILYELLTGRPPFRGETATATLQQVVADDPVLPGRLNPAVPRDLETICLKCLQKGPSERYASAAALADDLRRFERGEPISARRAGALERAVKWARRRPAAAALLAAGVLMLGGITAAAVWYVGDRARLRAEEDSRSAKVNGEANAALGQAEIHLKRLRARLDDPLAVRELLSDIEKWQGLVEHAGEDLKRAKSACVGNEALLAEETRARMQVVEATVGREQAAYGLAKDLDTIAVEAFTSSDSRYSQLLKAVADYERRFSQQGLDIHQPGTDWFASAIRSSPARFALIAALDNWAWIAGMNKCNERMWILIRQGVGDRTAWCAALREDPQLARLLELAKAADPDPWRDRFRDPALWADPAAVAPLADEQDVGRHSPTVLASLGWWLDSEAAATALYQRVLLDYPRDFWLHLHAAMRAREPGAKAGLARAAIAIRPRNAMAYAQLALGLQEGGHWPESLLAVNRAIEINSNLAFAYQLRGLALLHEPDLPRAVASFQRAIDLDPGRHLAHYNLGQVLQQQGRYAEAEQAYLGAIKAHPTSNHAYNSLARLLATCRDDKARDGKRAVEYATTACERTDWKDPLFLDTLAAAYAEARRFDEAVRYQMQALDDPALKGDLRTAAEKRLELYREKKPFREQGP